MSRTRYKKNQASEERRRRNNDTTHSTTTTSIELCIRSPPPDLLFSISFPLPLPSALYAIPNPTFANPSLPSNPRSLILLPSINPLNPRFCSPTTELHAPFHTSILAAASVSNPRLKLLEALRPSAGSPSSPSPALLALTALVGSSVSSSSVSLAMPVCPGRGVVLAERPFAISVLTLNPSRPALGSDPLTPFVIKPSIPPRLAVLIGMSLSRIVARLVAKCTLSPPPAPIAAALKMAAALRPSREECRRWTTASSRPEIL